MADPFARKLTLVLKLLSMSRARLAADIGVDKSVVARWASGATTPSEHNLAQLSALMAARIPGFTALDWERDLDDLASLFGLNPAARPGVAPGRGALMLPLVEQILAQADLRGPAYEGFYRSTRAMASQPGFFINDHVLVWREPGGHLRMKMVSGGVRVDGWVLPVQHQIYVIGTEMRSGGLVFAILHGINAARAEVLEGITLSPLYDAGRTVAATPMLLERVGELSGDLEADCARLEAMDRPEPFANAAAMTPELRARLAPDVGPASLKAGGDWVLRLPLVEALSRGAQLGDRPPTPNPS